MNERIDNLMVKAGAYFGGEGVDYSNFDPKRLAELIVRQCAEVGLDSVEDGDDLDAIMKLVHNNILKHFGVKE